MDGFVSLVRDYLCENGVVLPSKLDSQGLGI
jgi:hypothetical protein